VARQVVRFKVDAALLPLVTDNLPTLSVRGNKPVETPRT
jgi:hypothetical protein